jgi:hypothetical protein
LPSYLPYLLARPSGDREKAWTAAISQAAELDGLLAQPLGKNPEGQINDLKQVTLSLQDNLDRLRQPLDRVKQANPKKLLDEGGPGGDLTQVLTAIADIDALLETPWPTAAERATLWKTRLRLTPDLHEKTRVLDKQDNAGEDPTPVPKDTPALEANPPGPRLARQLRLSPSLLKLAGLPADDLGRLETLADKAARPQASPDDREQAAEAFWDAWTTQLHDKINQLSAPAADRLVRVLHPFQRNTAGQQLLDQGQIRPAAQFRRAEAQAYWKWLGKRTEAWSKVLDQVKEYQQLYIQAAEDYLNCAKESAG